MRPTSTSKLLALALALGSSAVLAAEDPAQWNNQRRNLNLDRGNRAAEERIYEKALEYYQKYWEDGQACKDPEMLVMATIRIAETGLRLGRPDLASAAVARYLDRKQQVPPEYQDTFAFIQAATLLGAGQAKECREFLAARLPGFQDPLEVLRGSILLGDALIQLGDYAQAQQVLQKLLDTQKADAENTMRIRFALLRARLFAGSLDAAAQDIAALQKTSADTLQLRLFQVYFLVRKGPASLDEANAAYAGIKGERPIQGNFDWWVVANALADALTAAGRHKDAEPVLVDALLFAITSADKDIAELRRADNLVEQQRIPEAVELLKKYNEVRAGYAELAKVNFKLGDLNRSLKSYDEALRYYSLAAENPRADASLRYRARFNIASCHRERLEYSVAAQKFAEAAAAGTSDAEKADASLQGAESLRSGRELAAAAALYKTVADAYPALPQGEDARRWQGRALFDSGHYAEAVAAYDLYIQAYPKGKGRYLDTVWLERGIALRDGGQRELALKNFKELAENFKESTDIVPKALEEGYKTALAMGAADEVALLTKRLTTDFKDTPYHPRALYWKTYVAFAKQWHPEFEQGAEEYLSRYARTDEAAAVSISFMLADWYSSQGEFGKALRLFSTVRNDYPQAAEAPKAAYEAARICLFQKDYDKGLTFLEELQRHEKFTGELRYLAFLLQGDLLKAKGSVAEAVAAFGKAVAETAPHTRPWWIAKGSQAEAVLAQALAAKTETDGQELRKIQETALAQFNEALRDGDEIPADVRDRLLFGRGTLQQEMKDWSGAYQSYYEIVSRYDEELVREKKERDWLFLEKAAFLAADMAIRCREYDSADRIYSRIIRMGLPLRDEADARRKRLLDALRERDLKKLEEGASRDANAS